MILNKQALLDGQVSFEKGVDTQKAPSRVPRNQLCLLTNSTTRTDYIGPRPRWRQVALTFADSTTRSDFENGFFQSFTGYIPDVDPMHLVWSISGKLFRVNVLTDSSVESLTLPDPNPTNRPRAWFKQAEVFLIWQDGQSPPLIYDGGSVRRSDITGSSGTDADGRPLYEVPVGTIMEYSGGRLWVVLPNGTSFVAGDGVYGPTGTPTYNRRDSILRFTENAYLAGGFPFAVPSNMGPITAMRALANLDTSLGQGPMQVFTPAGAFSIQAPFDRTQWASTTDPIKTVSLLEYGFLSQDSTVLVNGDAWGRSLNGIRSFIIARRDFNTWGNRAMSHEVDRWLSRDDSALLAHSSAAVFDDRLLVTTGPQWDQTHGVYHSGLVALDFHPLTSIGEVEQPTWEGLWNQEFGDILQIQKISARGLDYCYAAVLSPPDANAERKITLWQLTTERGPDIAATGTESRLIRIIESPRFDFSTSGSNSLEQKLLESFDAWIGNVSGTVDFRLYHRPDEYPCWFFWKHWQVCAKTRRCSSDAIDGCLSGLTLKPQFRPRIGATRPPDALIDSINQPSRLGYGHQYRLEITGDCDLVSVRLLANRVLEATFGLDLPETATCEEIICCDP